MATKHSSNRHSTKILYTFGKKKKKLKQDILMGTHRKMTDHEMLDKFGSKTLKENRVVSHEWDKPSELRRMGKLPNGTPIMINRILPKRISELA